MWETKEILTQILTSLLKCSREFKFIFIFVICQYSLRLDNVDMSRRVKFIFAINLLIITKTTIKIHKHFINISSY